MIRIRYVWVTRIRIRFIQDRIRVSGSGKNLTGSATIVALKRTQSKRVEQMLEPLTKWKNTEKLTERN